MNVRVGLLILTFLLSVGPWARAQTICSGSTIMLYSACTTQGKQIFDCDDTFNFNMMFCNGTQYLLMQLNATTACTSATLGKMRWNDSTGANGTGWYEFCDGTSWYSTQGTLYPGGCSTRKKQRWNTTAGIMQFCDGTNWYNMGPTVVKITASQSYTVPSYATGIIISAWGGGGGGGAAANSTTNGGNGSATTVVIPAPISVTLTANGGTGGFAGAAAGTPGAGGAGGTATGTGATTVTGNTGDSTTTQTGGSGGAASRGGQRGVATTTHGKVKVSADGGDPGSGGAGDSGANASKRGGGGGGGGGYASIQYNNTSLVGLTLTITIGSSGTAGNSGAGIGGKGQVSIIYW